MTRAVKHEAWLLTWSLVVPACSAPLDAELPDESSTLGHQASALAMGQGGQIDGAAGPVGFVTISAPAGVHTVLETQDCDEGVDPVMHVMDSARRGVAWDESTASEPTVRVFLRSVAGGPHTVMLRAKADGPRGQCTLVQDGVPQGRVHVGGMLVTLSNLRAREVLETVALPGDDGTAHTMYMLDRFGVGIDWSATGGGTGPGAYKELSSALGSRQVLVSTPSAAARLVRNDARAVGDRDGDGLGNELEQALGTCSDLSSVVAGFPCALAADARDTDGDGLSDGWEVLGRRDLRPHQTLPAWGSDARHKDLFAEVDFMQRTGPDEADQRMTGEVARQMAAYFASTDRERSQAAQELIARSLRNPDGVPGIALHMDTGVAPSDPDDLTLYGDWGGHTVVPPVLVDGDHRGRSPSEWRSYMAAARHGMFRYLLGYVGGGGSCGEHSIYCGIPIDSAAVSAHEMGHTLGSGHSGPSYGDTADPNCKPNYWSLMNYSYLGRTGFHDGSGPSLDPLALRERSVGGTPEFYTQLASVFRYNVDHVNGYVDWNRDGVFSTSPVQEYVNYTPHSGGCEWTRSGATQLGGASLARPAVIGLGDNVGVFYREPSKHRLRYKFSSDAASCPTATVGCNGATWSEAVDLGDEPISGVDAAVVQVGRQSRVMVASVTARHELLIEWFAANDSHLGRSLLREELEKGDVQGPLSLAVQPDGSVMLAYLGSMDRSVWTRKFDGGRWQAAEPALRADGTHVEAGAHGGASLAYASVPRQGGRSLADYDTGLYLLVPEGEQHTLALYLLHTQSQRFVPVAPWENAAPSDVRGQASLVFAPAQAGRSARTYLHFETGSNGSMHRMISYAQGLGEAARHVLGLKGYFDNAWYETYGHDVLYRPGVDTNLRVAAALRSENESRNGRLEFRPFADGIARHEMVAWNDFETFGIDLCRMAVASSSTNPIRCHPWKWGEGTYGNLVRASADPRFCVHKKAPDWTNGNVLHSWDCQSGGAANKTWTYERATGHIRATDNATKCWHKTRSDWQPGQAVHLWDCAAGGPEQKAWRIDPMTEQIRARYNESMCIVREPGEWVNGKVLRLEPCDTVGASARRWTF